MKLTFNLEIEDWIHFQEYYKAKKAPIYKYLGPLLVFSAVLLVTINAMYLIYQEASLITLFSLFMLGIIFYLLYLKSHSKKLLRKTALDIQSKNPDAFGFREMDFENKGVEIKAGHSHKLLAWGELTNHEEDKDYLFLFSQKGMVYIIPKRDIIDVSELRNILNEHLKVD